MEYPVLIGYDPENVKRSAYQSQGARSPREAACKALRKKFLRGEMNDPGTYTVTVLVDGEPEAFDVVAEPTIETYIA